MATVSMSLYDALLKKKLYEKRIKKLSITRNQFLFFGYKNDEQKVFEGVEVDSIPKVIEANFKKYDALFKNYAAVRRAIYKANNENTVTIDNVEYTITEALSRYENIKYEREFVQAVVADLQDVMTVINNNNNRVTKENILNDIMKTTKKDSDDSDESLGAAINAMVDKIFNDRLYHLVDTNKLVESNWIEDKFNELDEFENRFHSAINKANHEIFVTYEAVD